MWRNEFVEKVIEKNKKQQQAQELEIKGKKINLKGNKLSSSKMERGKAYFD